MATITLYPTGAGFETGLTPTGPSFNWDCVKDTTPDDDTTYVSWVGGTNQDFYTIGSNSLSVNDTINSVTVYTRSRVLSVSKASGRTASRIRENSTSTTATQSILTTSYGNFSNTWSTKPSSGTAWTKTDIDNLQIGVQLVGSGTTARCTQVYCVIDYTPGSVTTSPNVLIWQFDD